MSRPRRLLSLGHSYVVRANRRLAHEMAVAGAGEWEVVAASPDYFHGTRDLRPSTLELGHDEPCRVVPLRAHLTTRVHLFLYGRSLRALLHEGWDVVHCWEEPYILAGGQVALWTPRQAQLVYRSAQSLPKRYPPPFGWIEQYALRRAAGWICSGSLVEENLRCRPGYVDRPSRRIPLGVDLTAFHPDPARRNATRRELGWDADETPVVGFLGRFSAEKGLPLLMRALDQLDVPWRALMVGAGPLEGELRAWARRHGERVRVLTEVRHDDVPRHLNAMDLLCAPSQTTPAWKEQFGRMLVEAFASGIPVIGSDSGEVPRVIGDTGWVVGERDEIGWARTLTAALSDGVLRADAAARGLDRARTEFAWPVVARQYLEFFDELQGRACP